APRGELVRFVMLSRHGVRSPLQNTDDLNQWRRSPDPQWPDWGVKSGELTRKGATLIKLMGEYYRKYLNDKIFTPGQCPKDDVFIWADFDERTRATAAALVVGLAAGKPPRPCTFPIKVDHNHPDPLFHPTQAEKILPKCSLDPKEVHRSVGNLDDLKRKLKPQLAKTQNILQCCSSKLCESEHLPPQTCELQDLRSWIEPNPNINPDPQHVSVKVKGGLGDAQSFAETLMLEYAQGFSGQDFGFGRVTPADMLDTTLDILKIHTGVFDKVQRRASYVAQRQGDNLLYHIAYAVEYGRDPTETERDKKFIAYIGHDTNIANVAGLLNLHWQVSKYPVDDMPPGGALIFEVRKESDNQLFVNAVFAAQSPETMRQEDKAEAEMKAEAKMVAVSIPCARKRIDGSCSMKEFTHLTGKAVKNEANPVCVTDLHPELPRR
ncbi:MAG: histidine-type phosphatase, partial [Methylocella sp.]